MHPLRTLAPLCALLGAVAGCTDAGVDDLGLRDLSTSTTQDLAVDAAAPDTAPPLVEVAVPRELRAVWVATVHRLDFPSSTSLTPAAARSELKGIVDRAAALGLNAIFFQARPESDALYASTLEPQSRFLSGTQGSDPGYDPLAILVELAHAAGIEVHAWLNPYRAQAGTGVATAANHVTKRFPSAAVTYGSSITMNPADPAVRAHILAVVTDIVHRYDIDGVVFDDYFYPYPSGNTAFPDAASYTAYTSAGGTLGKSDWRRENVNALVAATAAAIRAEKSWVRFGISPFGIYRPGTPPGITGLDAYEVLACDPVRWIDEGWVDYLSPQLYWTTASAGQPFAELIAWWASIAKPDRPIIVALAVHSLGSAAQWTLAELETQVALARAAPRSLGQTLFREQSLADAPVAATFAALYAGPARPPVVPGAATAQVSPPEVVRNGGELALSHAAPETIRGYAIHEAGAFRRWVPAGSPPITLPAGSYVISAVDRGGVESLGRPIDLP